MKTKYYQCTECGYIVHKTKARCRCEKCNAAVLPYKDRLGININQYELIDGVLYLR